MKAAFWTNRVVRIMARPNLNFVHAVGIVAISAAMPDGPANPVTVSLWFVACVAVIVLGAWVEIMVERAQCQMLEHMQRKSDGDR